MNITLPFDSVSLNVEASHLVMLSVLFHGVCLFYDLQL